MNFIREIIRTYEEFKGGRDFFWLGTPGKVAEKRQHSSQGLTDGIRWKDIKLERYQDVSLVG